MESLVDAIFEDETMRLAPSREGLVDLWLDLADGRTVVRVQHCPPKAVGLPFDFLDREYDY